jgi:hypothetical protein
VEQSEFERFSSLLLPCSTSPLLYCRGSGNRGDRRWTFPNDFSGETLLMRAVTQVFSFTAVEFLATPAA